MQTSRGCTCLRCTNKANSANYRRVWHPAIPTHPPNYLPTEATEPTEVSDARYSPTDVRRLEGYGILAIPTHPPNYLPTEPTEPTEVSDARYSPTDCTDVRRLEGYGIPAIPTQPPNYLPTEATEPTEVSGARFSPTDCTDVHRLGGYGIPAIPTQPTNYLPTEPTESTEFFWRKIFSHRLHRCAQIRRVWHPCHTHAANQTIFPQNPTQPNHL